MFLSGSLHFGIKFYCSDEEESSKLLFFVSSVPTAADTLCRTVARLGLTNRYFDNDNHPKFF